MDLAKSTFLVFRCWCGHLQAHVLCAEKWPPSAVSGRVSAPHCVSSGPRPAGLGVHTALLTSLPALSECPSHGAGGGGQGGSAWHVGMSVMHTCLSSSPHTQVT